MGKSTSVVHDPVVMPSAGQFRLDLEHGPDGAIVLVVQGDADLHVAAELRERLTRTIDEGASALVVDLSDVTFVDSMALGVLLGAMKRMRAAGGRLRLVVARPEVRRIFEITLLDRVLAIDATREEALANLGSAGERT
jgi:anti-sigma B factor antagonist